MYPSNPYEVGVNLAIHPGDKLTATVKFQPGATTATYYRGRVRYTSARASYLLSLNDSTTGRSYAATISPRQTTYARSSAEVITEAPYSGGVLPLADYGAADYTATLVNGTPMGGLPNLQDIIMQNPAGMTSTPSPFDPSDEDFVTTWTAATPTFSASAERKS